MCLPRISRIIEVDGEEAIVDGDGNHARISLLCVPTARTGDHVMIHAGFAIRVLEAEEAAERTAMIASVRGEGFRL